MATGNVLQQDTYASAATLSIVIADDDEGLRRRLLRSLTRLPSVRVVGEAADAAAAVDVITRLAPAVVILDATMPKGGGLRVLEGIRQAEFRPLVIAFTGHGEPEYEQAYLEAGADHFLVKSRDWERLLELLRALST